MIVIVIVIYFLSMFLATFFNVAFYSEIIAALDGRGVSFRRGLATAREPIAVHPGLVAAGRGGRMAHPHAWSNGCRWPDGSWPD